MGFVAVPGRQLSAGLQDRAEGTDRTGAARRAPLECLRVIGQEPALIEVPRVHG